MSNPGVLYLSNVRLGNGVNFRVEDNIGEAIHFHYGDEWRIDLTVEEYFSLISKIDVCIEDLLKGTGFEMKLFDPIFLDMISSFLLDLESVYIENIKLSPLIVETKNVIGLPVMRSLSQSRIVKALKGQTRELEEYKQENYKGQTNIERVERMKTNISLNGYPFDGKYIVVFNNQNVIKDGQHRAACLLYEKGDMVVPVVRMQFKNNKYNVSMHPWFNKLFIWNVHRIKRGVKKILLFQKHFMIRMKRKILKR